MQSFLRLLSRLETLFRIPSLSFLVTTDDTTILVSFYLFAGYLFLDFGAICTLSNKISALLKRLKSSKTR